MDRVEVKGLATAGQTSAGILGVAAGGDEVAARRATVMGFWCIRRVRQRCLRKQRSLGGDGHIRVAVHSRSSGGRHTTGKRQLFSRAGHILIAKKEPPVDSVLGRWRGGCHVPVAVAERLVVVVEVRSKGRSVGSAVTENGLDRWGSGRGGGER